MRVLIAEDDIVTARLLKTLIGSWGYEVIEATDGPTALAVLDGADPPELALLDWMMPGLEGPDVCRAVRQRRAAALGAAANLDEAVRVRVRVPTYVMLLTSRDARTDVVTGLEAGADDYLIKPFVRDELHARLNAAARIIQLEHRLAAQVEELELALAKVRRLSGLLPICAYCKSIRDDSDYWHDVETYVAEHAEVQFSHGICPRCFEAVAKQALEESGTRQRPHGDIKGSAR